MERAGQRVDLAAGVVDVVFAGDGEAGLLQQRRQRVADDRAAAVADVQRAGRIGRDVFDVDRPPGADGGVAVGGAGGEDLGEPGVPERRASAAG